MCWPLVDFSSGNLEVEWVTSAAVGLPTSCSSSPHEKIHTHMRKCAPASIIAPYPKHRMQ